MTTIARVLGHVGDIRRFKNAKASAAFLGVAPKQRTFGSSVRGRTVMSKTGSSSLRAALFMPSMVARRHNPVLRQFATGMARKAVIGAVTHKLAHLIYRVIRTDKPFDPNFLSNRLAIQDGIWPGISNGELVLELSLEPRRISLPMIHRCLLMVAVGEVWKHKNSYTHRDTAELLPKYFPILAVHDNRDITFRLLTSREYNRVSVPACV
jgi:hypothetical protein